MNGDAWRGAAKARRNPILPPLSGWLARLATERERQLASTRRFSVSRLISRLSSRVVSGGRRRGAPLAVAPLVAGCSARRPRPRRPPRHRGALTPGGRRSDGDADIARTRSRRPARSQRSRREGASGDEPSVRLAHRRSRVAAAASASSRGGGTPGSWNLGVAHSAANKKDQRDYVDALFAQYPHLMEAAEADDWKRCTRVDGRCVPPRAGRVDREDPRRAGSRRRARRARGQRQVPAPAPGPRRDLGLFEDVVGSDPDGGRLHASDGHRVRGAGEPRCWTCCCPRPSA